MQNLVKIISAVLLTSILFVAVGGAFNMAHTNAGMQSDDCLFSTMGESLCPQDLLAQAVHHIAAYQSFFSVPLTAFASLIFMIAILVFFYLPTVLPTLRPVRIVSTATPPYPRNFISSWLALLEHSPSA